VVVEARLPDRSVGVEDRCGPQVEGRIEELLDERPERVAFREARNLI
jgi:hypothetical protein